MRKRVVRSNPSDTSKASSLEAPAGEGLAWGAGLALTASCVAVLLRVEPGGSRWLLSGLALLAFALPLLGTRDPTPRACAAAAGAVAGWVVGIALALPVPAGWFFPDIAWHTAKAAVAASGHPLHDPILRTPTLYPFLFAAAVGAPVSLGVSAATAMWAAAPLSLAGAFAAYYALARSVLSPGSAAWASAALPAFFFNPSRGYALLPTPFGLSLSCVFLGLALTLRARSAGDRRLLGAGLALGAAGLLWYAHLPWIVLFTLWLVWREPRRLRLLALGALPCALALAFHLAVLAQGGLLSGSAVTAGGVEGGWLRWLGVVGRNALTLSGSAPLARVPAWIGPLLLALLAVAWWRPARPSGEGEGAAGPTHGRVDPALWAACACLALLPLLAGHRLTYGEFFLWRYTFVLYALLLVIAASALPFPVGGRRVPVLALAALAAAVWAPGWLLGRHAATVADAARFEAETRPVVRFLEAHTTFDEPVFAPFDVWEETIGCCAPRPNLVDRGGGSYKYASAAAVGTRWQDYRSLRGETDPKRAAALLRAYGVRFAVLRRGSKGRGFATLEKSFETAVETEAYVIVDLGRPATQDPDAMR